MSLLRLFKLWSVAMRREGISPARHALPLAVHALRSLPFVTPERWRRRMRACSRCPIYNRETKQCRSDVPVRLGCGCSCPVKFLFAGETCWAREQGIYGLGWPEDVT